MISQQNFQPSTMNSERAYELFEKLKGFIKVGESNEEMFGIWSRDAESYTLGVLKDKYEGLPKMAFLCFKASEIFDFVSVTVKEITFEAFLKLYNITLTDL